jgi:hypothetical protein
MRPALTRSASDQRRRVLKVGPLGQSIVKTTVSAARKEPMASAMKSGCPGVSMYCRYLPFHGRWKMCEVSVWCRSCSSGSVSLMLEPSSVLPWRGVTLAT